METMYAICASRRRDRINEKRSLTDIGRNQWYETGDGLAYKFTKSQINEIKQYMRNKLLYYAVIIGTDGSRENWSAFTPKREIQTPQIAIKMSGFMIKMKI